MEINKFILYAIIGDTNEFGKQIDVDRNDLFIFSQPFDPQNI